MDVKRAFLFANGDLRKKETVLSLIEPEDLLVAVDGGFRHLHEFNYQPHIAVGDFDSIDPQQVEILEADGVEIIRFPEKKDETDLELALEIVLNRGFQFIRIVGALGGRLDQTLGNLFLMEMPGLEGCDIRLEDGIEQAFLIRSDAKLKGNPGDRISLIPLSEVVGGVSTKSLEFPLNDETLYRYKTRGISNVLMEYTAQIKIKEGLLLCIHTRAEQEVYEVEE